MTAIFDSLAVLGYRAKGQLSLVPLVDEIFNEAIRQINSLPQDTCKWMNYVATHKKMYFKLYGEHEGIFEMKMGFLNYVNDYLDHTRKWHCRCFADSFKWTVVYRIKTLLLAKKETEAYFSYRDIHWKHRKRYSVILDLLKQLIKSGRILPPFCMDTPTKKWLGKIEPCKIGMKPTETEKIMGDKKLMNLIRKARKKGSKSSLYKPLVESTKEEDKNERP